MSERMWKIKRAYADMILKHKGIKKNPGKIKIPIFKKLFFLFAPKKEKTYIDKKVSEYKQTYRLLRKKLSHGIRLP